jgi:hypothetical protein
MGCAHCNKEKSAASKAAHAAVAMGQAVLNPRAVSERKRIWSICKKCESISDKESSLAHCTECSCLLLPKIASPGEECPIGSW